MTKIDASLFLQMENLMYALLKEDDAYLEYGYKAYYDEIEKRLSLVTFGMIERRGYSNRIKSEVFLKALGNKHYSDMTLIRSYAIELQESPLKSF